MISEEDIAIKLYDALVVAVRLPVLLSLHYWLHKVLTYQILVLQLKFNVVYRRDLEPGDNSVLGSPHFFSVVEGLKRSLVQSLIEGHFGLNIYRYLRLAFADSGKRVCVLHFSEADFIVLLDEGVESIFNFVFGAAGKVFAYFRPLAANITIELQNVPVFFFSPFFLFYFRVQLVDEPLPNLLAILAPQHLRKEFPVLAIFLDELPHSFIFFG